MENEYNSKYDSKRRFASYWHQIQEVLSLRPRNVLEIGVGSSFVSGYLRNKGINLTTADISEKLKPDVVADINKLPFKNNSFDVVTAFEVLEHMPYEKAVKALSELRRVAIKKVIISLPDATRAAPIQFPIPGVTRIRKLVVLPRMFPKVHKLTKSGHHWEIGKRGYELGKIKKELLNRGFKLIRTYRVFENPHHRFFILSV